MNEIQTNVQSFLSKEGHPASCRRVAQQLNIPQTQASRALNALVKAGIAKVELRREYDFEYCHKYSRTIACLRRRNYYWIEVPIKKPKKKAKLKVAN